eukprot:TRINITY_DN47276_c0_g1_i2.p1 TRINITY_DN47276_c0_g1~~TRINITY_DN47276_c0_g1_i2.p1  ORF type:complete len:337 (-),score=61.04 TRINITY_DN47276_c0_g1_i2:78-1088(-)
MLDEPSKRALHAAWLCKYVRLWCCLAAFVSAVRVGDEEPVRSGVAPAATGADTGASAGAAAQGVTEFGIAQQASPEADVAGPARPHASLEQRSAEAATSAGSSATAPSAATKEAVSTNSSKAQENARSMDKQERSQEKSSPTAASAVDEEKAARAATQELEQLLERTEAKLASVAAPGAFDLSQQRSTALSPAAQRGEDVLLDFRMRSVNGTTVRGCVVDGTQTWFGTSVGCKLAKDCKCSPIETCYARYESLEPYGLQGIGDIGVCSIHLVALILLSLAIVVLGFICMVCCRRSTLLERLCWCLPGPESAMTVAAPSVEAKRSGCSRGQTSGRRL